MMKVYKEKKISKLVIGVDEVGRGTLAGPVLSAAVILPFDFNINQLNDSKKLSKIQREKVFKIIKKHCNYKIGIADVNEIDKYNILEATFLSMKRAINKFSCVKNYKIIVDGPFSFDKKNKNIVPIVKGDTKFPSIAAASIVAKVHRDKLMTNLSKKFTNYFWEKNAGYGTTQHLQAIQNYGVTIHHRKSFSPIGKILKLKAI